MNNCHYWTSRSKRVHETNVACVTVAQNGFDYKRTLRMLQETSVHKKFKQQLQQPQIHTKNTTMKVREKPKSKCEIVKEKKVI